MVGKCRQMKGSSKMGNTSCSLNPTKGKAVNQPGQQPDFHPRPVAKEEMIGADDTTVDQASTSDDSVFSACTVDFVAGLSDVKYYQTFLPRPVVDVVDLLTSDEEEEGFLDRSFSIASGSVSMSAVSNNSGESITVDEVFPAELMTGTPMTAIKTRKRSAEHDDSQEDVLVLPTPKRAFLDVREVPVANHEWQERGGRTVLPNSSSTPKDRFFVGPSFQRKQSFAESPLQACAEQEAEVQHDNVPPGADGELPVKKLHVRSFAAMPQVEPQQEVTADSSAIIILDGDSDAEEQPKCGPADSKTFFPPNDDGNLPVPNPRGSWERVFKGEVEGRRTCSEEPEVDLSILPPHSVRMVAWTRFRRSFATGRLCIRLQQDPNGPVLLAVPPETVHEVCDTSTDIRDLKPGSVVLPVVDELLTPSAADEGSLTFAYLVCDGIRWTLVDRVPPPSQPAAEAPAPSEGGDPDPAKVEKELAYSASNSSLKQLEELVEKNVQLQDLLAKTKAAFDDIRVMSSSFEFNGSPRLTESCVQPVHRPPATETGTQCNMVALADKITQAVPIATTDNFTQVERIELTCRAVQAEAVGVATRSSQTDCRISVDRETQYEHVDQDADVQVVVNPISADDLKATIIRLALQVREKDKEMSALRTRLEETEECLLDSVRNYTKLDAIIQQIRADSSASASISRQQNPAPVHLPDDIEVAPVARRSDADSPTGLSNAQAMARAEAIIGGRSLAFPETLANRQHVGGVYKDAFPLKPEVVMELARECSATKFVGNVMKYAFTRDYLAEKSFTKMDVAHREAVIEVTLEHFPTFSTSDDLRSLQPLSRAVVKHFISQKFSNYKQQRKHELVKTETRKRPPARK